MLSLNSSGSFELLPSTGVSSSVGLEGCSLTKTNSF